MENLWAGGYPALETRPPRGTTAVLKAPHGLVCRDAPVWVDGTALYVNGDRTGLVLTEGGKQLVSMGAYLLIWPDKKYINTQDLTEFGSMEHRTVTTGEVTISLCRSGGEELGSYSIGGEAPAAPGTGSLWMDTADGAVPVYGVAVGQDLVCREVDGQQVVEQNNFRAVFTATRLSFWQDATEVAYVSNNRLYITNITVLGGIAIGDWSVEAAESGLLFRWIGG